MGAKAKANSGVFIHVHNRYDPVNTGMEVQILDNQDYNVPFNAGNACGALYDLVRPSVDANRPIGQWNHLLITINDNLVTVEMNGQQYRQGRPESLEGGGKESRRLAQQVPLRDRFAAARGFC